MRELILKFLRPYVLQILKESSGLVNAKNGIVADVVANDPPIRTGGGLP